MAKLRLQLYEDFKKETKDKKLASLMFFGFIVIRIIIPILFLLYITPLIIRMFKPELIDRFSSLCKFTEFLCNRKFVLGAGLVFACIFLLTKIFSFLTAVCIKTYEDEKTKQTTKEPEEDEDVIVNLIPEFAQSLIGSSVAITAIVFLSLMLQNKISPNIAGIMEKALIGSFTYGMIIAPLLVGFIVLVSGFLIHCSDKNLGDRNKSYEKLNVFANIMNFISGCFATSMLYALRSRITDNGIEVIPESEKIKHPITIHFMNIFELELHRDK